MNENRNLPKDWKWKKLGEVCHTTSGGTPSRREPKYYNGNIPWVKSGELDKGLITDTEEKISEEAVKNSSAKIFPKGTLLIALYDATIGKLAFLGVNAATNQAICGIYQNESISSRFLYYYLFYKKQKLVNEGIGGAQPNISQTILKNLELPLPPVDSQQQIVSKIEELFSEVDKGIEEIKTAQHQLKVYRLSVLKWAFEGRLINTDVKEGAFPKGWKLQKLHDIGVWRGGGTPSTTRNDFWENGNILWVSPKDMKSKVIQDTIDKITLDAVEKSTAQIIPTGSILFVVRSGILRRTLPVAITICDVTVNQDIKALTPKEVLPDYIFYYVQAKNDDIRRTCSKDGTTVESIETSSLKSYQIPICSVEEQQQVVQEVESRLSVCDKIEETITNSLKQAEALRQIILKKAFEGKLV